jgi:hypothetical protein
MGNLRDVSENYLVRLRNLVSPVRIFVPTSLQTKKKEMLETFLKRKKAIKLSTYLC